MKVLAFILLGILLSSPLMVHAQEEDADLELSMTLEDDITEGGRYAYAVGYVYVNVTEPPPQLFGISGLFAFEPFDFEGFVEGIMSFFGLS